MDSGPEKSNIRCALGGCIPPPALPRESWPPKSGLASAVDEHCLAAFSFTQQDKQ